MTTKFCINCKFYVETCSDPTLGRCTHHIFEVNLVTGITKYPHCDVERMTLSCYSDESCTPAGRNFQPKTA